jgi:hypothetical protein
MGNHVYTNLSAGNLSDPITEFALDLRHLRWDLTAMLGMAIAEKVIEANQAIRLYTPKQAPEGRTRAMSGKR